MGGGGEGGWILLRSTVSCDQALLISFHFTDCSSPVMWTSESHHFPLASILFIRSLSFDGLLLFIDFSRELKPVCLLANKYVPCKGHLISKITIKTVKRTIEPKLLDKARKKISSACDKWCAREWMRRAALFVYARLIEPIVSAYG